jgi:hypothetical protein
MDDEFDALAESAKNAAKTFENIKEFLEEFRQDLPRPENRIKPFPNPFTDWWYGQDRDYAWCKEVPDIPEGPGLKGIAAKYSHIDEPFDMPETKGVSPLDWCISQLRAGRVYYDFNMNTDFEHDPFHDPYRPAYVPNIFGKKYIPRLKPMPKKKYPESTVKIDPEQMERLLNELKEL